MHLQVSTGSLRFDPASPFPLAEGEPDLSSPLPDFRHYISLGDSISIDLYPGLDVAEREGLSRPPAGLGAASLLYANDDERWPEFARRDLTSRFPGIVHRDLTVDGATTGTTLAFQLPRLRLEWEGPCLVTLTVGGNDLLGLLEVQLGRRGALPPGAGREAVEEVARNLSSILREVRALLDGVTMLVGSVYDPSDGKGDLGDGVVRERELGWLHLFNRRVEEIAREEGARAVPIHDRFLGHGLTEPDVDARWYWRHNIIEPSARGASEVRRLWLEALGL